MKLFSIMWSSYIPLLKAGVDKVGHFELSVYSNKQITQRPEILEEVKQELKEADLILLYRTHDPFWGVIEEEVKALGGRLPVIVTGSDPSYWRLSTVNPEVVATVYQYILYNGQENLCEMLKYLLATLFGHEITYRPPRENPWEGIFHPEIGGPFSSVEEFLGNYPYKNRPLVGLLYSRSNWITGNMEVERALIMALEERGLGVIPVFFYSLKDKTLGNLSGEEVVRKFLVKGERPLVEALVKLTSFFLGSKKGEIRESQAEAGARLLLELGIPLISPLISYYKDKEEWFDDPQGLAQQVAWSIAMPEFEGAVEPIIIGATRGVSAPEEEFYEPIEERIVKVADRVAHWVALRRKPNEEKRVALILHNNPCASVEATVGGGAHLDTLESVAEILKRMKKEGYRVEDPPANGKELIDEIMRKKAISEFRWTTVDEILEKGGALALIDVDDYLKWFEELPERTRARMIEAWGEPPGEERDGVPPGMVYDGRLVVTGVRYGNAVVCVQPKRGCAGARCDGRVCKILHDPDVPPPHQYVTTYKWLSRNFGADVIIHVGTHGNLEFLPGKATGLSGGCFPDIGIDTVPHLYIYNADNPPEGTIAKRRSYAVLVDHMQTAMAQGELYGDLEEIERLLFEYEKVKDVEPGKAHFLGHMIEEKLKEGNLISMIKVPEGASFDDLVRSAHETLSMLKNTYIPKGMHVFGRIPEGERLTELVYAIVRYGNDPRSLRGLVRLLLEKEPEFSRLPDPVKKDRVEELARKICRNFLEKGVPLLEGMREISPEAEGFRDVISEIERKIEDVKQRVLLSDEMASLLRGMNGEYIPPGPSGIVTRGRDDILPTGRNFYSLDPRGIPTQAAWEIGKVLAEKTLEKYLSEEGRYPENIAFYWQCSDIMWADGEGMAQIMYLLGAKPLWEGGRVKGFEVIPLQELRRPRIDVTIRVSGITRDNFPCRIELLDEVIQAVAGLDEPPEMNFVRKHTLERLHEADSFREATYRIFCSMPGVYQAGTQLAVYASAWKDERDLAGVFLYWNGYAYGKGTFGEKAHRSLRAALKTVELTFNKTVTDEYDLFGCCCYFGTHGGLINAAKVVSGKEVKTYYGDTREQGEVQVRTLADEIRRVVRTKLLNPKWIEGMKAHGYKGAGDISKRIGRVYGWQATSREVDGWIFDEIARTYLMDEENRRFFEEHNPYALEEIARRLIEAHEWGLWQPAPDVKEALKEAYVEVEGWIEERMGEARGDFQGGAIDVVTAHEVEGWRQRMEEMLGEGAR